MIDSKAKADKELQVIASRFRELGYTPNVDLKSDGSGYEFNSKPYMTTATDERGQRRFKAESDLRKDFAAMMNDDNKPLHYLFKKRYRVSFISDPVDLLGELNKNPKYIMCCFPNCVIFVTVNSSPQSIYGIGSDRVQTKRYVDLIDAALKNKNSSTSVNVKEYIIRGRYASIDQHLFSVLWCPIICSNIDDNLKDIDGRKDIKEFPYSRQSLFKYFTHLVGSADKELPYIDIKYVKDATEIKGVGGQTYLCELNNKNPVKVPLIKWCESSTEPWSWSLDLVTDWWIWDGQSDFTDNSPVMDETDHNALTYTLRIYDGGQEFYLEPDWKPTADDETAATAVQNAGNDVRRTASTPPPADIDKQVATAEDTRADSNAETDPNLRRRFLNRWYEFRKNRASTPKDCSGYWHKREHADFQDKDVFCKIDINSRNANLRFYKKATTAAGVRSDVPLKSDLLVDITFPSDDHPLCGNIRFKPLAAGNNDGEKQVRYGVLFSWSSRHGWAVQLEWNEPDLKLDDKEYVLYNTPLGVRAYQK